ncbi:isoflavone reductase [Ilyonectria robusta]|uniref:isoflavone reductase n=1 Tax=Ilyonectria robusta TaxID=1079257 RepID=UPI001E8E7852|nr:isoflavone reductase [Ilyonectria robusta]KAH8714705.1 isoflavone reductase [Ilyonectria robusta]
MSLKNVSLVGASGNVGSSVLPELLKSDLVLSAVTRETSSAKFPEGVTHVKSDFSLSSLTEAFKGQDAVISMLPITALGDQAVVIEAAIAAGVKRFIPSEYGSDSTSDAVIAVVPFFEGKKKYLEYLKSQESSISWTALFTGPFFDWGLAAGFVGFDFATKTSTLIDGGKTRFTTSNVAQIGRAIVAVLSHATETANKLVFVESFTTTQLEIHAALEKASGEEWKVVNKTSESVRAEGFKLLGEGKILEGGGSLITALVLGKEGLEDHSDVEGGIWNSRLGLPVETVEETVQQVWLAKK